MKFPMTVQSVLERVDGRGVNNMLWQLVPTLDDQAAKPQGVFMAIHCTHSDFFHDFWRFTNTCMYVCMYVYYVLLE